MNRSSTALVPFLLFVMVYCIIQSTANIGTGKVKVKTLSNSGQYVKVFTSIAFKYNSVGHATVKSCVVYGQDLIWSTIVS